MATTAKAPPFKVELDPQDPLPESNWLWRRLLVFIGSIVISLFLWMIIEYVYALGLKNAGATIVALSALKWVAIGLIAWGFTREAIYTIAPSAEHFGKWVQSVSAWKAGVTFQTAQTAQTGDAAAASSTTVGKPDAAQVPAAEETGEPATAATPATAAPSIAAPPVTRASTVASE